MARVFKVTGDMDAAAMKTLRPSFEELAECGEDVVIEMNEVDFIDSSGVGAIVFLYKRLLQAKHKLTLQKLAGQPLQLLAYLRLSELVTR